MTTTEAKTIMDVDTAIARAIRATEKAASAERTREPAAPTCALPVATCSPSAGRADILRREGKRWWRLEQKAALRRDYLAAYEYAALSEKYYEQADAAERENVEVQRRPASEPSTTRDDHGRSL